MNNTCYFWQGLPFNYSPLWLRLTFLPTGHAAAVAISVALIVGFFLSLATLRPPRTVGELAVLLLALLSSATALAAERGNADLLMFLMAIGAANASLYALWVRLIGYGLLLAAGLLKFYPLAGLVIAVRDRAWVLLSAFIVSVAAVLALVLAFRPELATHGEKPAAAVLFLAAVRGGRLAGWCGCNPDQDDGRQPERAALGSDGVRDQVFDNPHVRQRVDRAGAPRSEINRVQASQFVPSIFMAQEPQTPHGTSDGR